MQQWPTFVLGPPDDTPPPAAGSPRPKEVFGSASLSLGAAGSVAATASTTASPGGQPIHQWSRSDFFGLAGVVLGGAGLVQAGRDQTADSVRSLREDIVAHGRDERVLLEGLLVAQLRSAQAAERTAGATERIADAAEELVRLEKVETEEAPPLVRSRIALRTFFGQVLDAVDAELYYLALFGALAIPDLCASMEAEDGLTNRVRYAAWFDTHVAPSYTAGVTAEQSLTGDDAYGLRCSMLHQGRTEPHRGAYTRVVFTERGIAHNNVMDDALNLDVGRFCGDVVMAALKWVDAAEHTTVYQRNYSSFLNRYPEGFPPYIVGIPVIT